MGPGVLSRLRTAAQLALALLALGPSGCRRYADQSARARTEGAVLERQVAGLRALVALAEQGSLLPADAFAIALDQGLVGQLLAAGLPHETVLAERFRARVERAEVSFEASQSLVTLHGRVSALADPGTFVDLDLRGGFDKLELQPGRLRARVVLDGFEVKSASAAGTASAGAAALVEELGRERLEAFEALVPALEVPVRLEERLAFRGLADGPFTVPPGELPLRAEVLRVFPFAGRLWLLLRVEAGPWMAPAAAASPEGKP